MTSTISTAERVQDLVSYVKAGRILDAINEFYADDVVMQDNRSAPTVGKAANIERESGFVGYIAEVQEMTDVHVLVDGDMAAINWHFEFTGVDGKRMRLEQVALQTWRDGQIINERFFYDSAVADISNR